MYIFISPLKSLAREVICPKIPPFKNPVGEIEEWHIFLYSYYLIKTLYEKPCEEKLIKEIVQYGA
jgi:hypothetical protein